jgi:hypothetical protein
MQAGSGFNAVHWLAGEGIQPAQKKAVPRTMAGNR